MNRHDRPGQSLSIIPHKSGCHDWKLKIITDTFLAVHVSNQTRVFVMSAWLQIWGKHYITRHALTHWGWVTHISVGNLTIIGSDNGLSPGRRQAIIWTNDGILLIGPLGTNFSEILIAILTFSLKKMRLEVSSGKWRPFCLGLNVLTPKQLETHECIHEYCGHWCLGAKTSITALDQFQI